MSNEHGCNRIYLEGLLGYLEGFYERTQPLQILDKAYATLEDFSTQFEEGAVADWEDRGEGQLATEADVQIDLDAFDSVEELLTLGEPLDYDIKRLGEEGGDG